MYEDLIFEEGKNYRLKIRRTTVDFMHTFDHFFEMITYKGKTAEKAGAWTILKDLPSMIRCQAGYPKDNNDMTITLIDTDEIIFPPLDKRKVKKKETKKKTNAKN